MTILWLGYVLNGTLDARCRELNSQYLAPPEDQIQPLCSLPIVLCDLRASAFLLARWTGLYYFCGLCTGISYIYINGVVDYKKLKRRSLYCLHITFWKWFLTPHLWVLYSPTRMSFSQVWHCTTKSISSVLISGGAGLIWEGAKEVSFIQHEHLTPL